MKIRSITYFLNPQYPFNPELFVRAGGFVRKARPAFENEGYEVQSARLACIPLPQLVPFEFKTQAVQVAQELEAAAKANGYGYVSMGPALPESLKSYEIIPTLLESTQDAFFSGIMADQERGISLPAVKACAEIMHAASTIDPNGFANLRFAALANVPPGTPFFPAAYHGGGEPSFALATEAANLAVEAFTRAASLEEARQNLISSLEAHYKVLTRVGSELQLQTGASFAGIDFSLAPYPDEQHSMGTALERLGVPATGLQGSLAAAAFLTDTLDRARIARVGFSGLFMPVLEDANLAARAADGSLTIKDLLLFSAVCGTGLDTVPLPGDTGPEQITALLLDLAALALRLNKPLTARLMPIPGKKAGDLTSFDFPYFANSRVMSLEAKPLHGALSGSEAFLIKPRRFWQDE